MNSEPIIGLIGVGIMGEGIGNNLLKKGFKLNIYSRTKDRISVQTLLQKGASWFETPADVASNSDIILTIVGFIPDVREIALGEKGVIKGNVKSKIFVQMATSDPALEEEIAKKFAKFGCQTLDAPVSGGDKGAREGTLAIMVGGDHKTFKKCLPVFEAIGAKEKIIHIGEHHGDGQIAKATNQIAIAGVMLGLAESYSMAKAGGLKPEKVFEAISGGAAGSWSQTNYIPRVFNGDLNPGFKVAHFLKDLDIALSIESNLRKNGKLIMPLDTVRLAKKVYQKISKNGFDNLGIQSIMAEARVAKWPKR